MGYKPVDYKRVHLKLCSKIYADEIPATLDADVVAAALRKQIPMQVAKSEKYGGDRCPMCDKVILHRTHHYCYQCGQKLDWRQ